MCQGSCAKLADDPGLACIILAGSQHWLLKLPAIMVMPDRRATLMLSTQPFAGIAAPRIINCKRSSMPSHALAVWHSKSSHPMVTGWFITSSIARSMFRYTLSRLA